MNDEERQKLCEALRDLSVPSAFRVANPTGAITAKEIERLAKANIDLWGIIRKLQNDVLVAERERDEVLCRLKGTMQ